MEISRIHVHAIVAEECCARPRIREPLGMLETIPGVRCTIGDHIPDHPTITIQQRFRNCSLDLQRSLINCGSIIVAELDDDPESLQGFPESDFLSLKAVHAIQVSTEQLARTCRQWNPYVQVFQNMIAELPEPRKHLVVASLGVVPKPWIFFGAQNRRSDWEPIMPALNRVLTDHDVRFEVVHDQEFYEALEIKSVTDSISCGKHFSPWLDYPEYRRTLRSCDIALIPLEPTPFNACKSDLKFIECVAEGVACLMSKTAFDQIPTDRIGYQRGALAETWKSTQVFEQSLRELIENRERRHLVASNAYDYVKEHRMLGQHFRDRLAWYMSLVHRKHELDSLLLERVPSLRSLP